MDNRGTPCLKGSKWRKSIYRKIGIINTLDQAHAAQEILKLPYLDNERRLLGGSSFFQSRISNIFITILDDFTIVITLVGDKDTLTIDDIKKSSGVKIILPTAFPAEFTISAQLYKSTI